MHSHEHTFILCFDEGYEHAWLNDIFRYQSHVCFNASMSMILPWIWYVCLFLPWICMMRCMVGAC